MCGWENEKPRPQNRGQKGRFCSTFPDSCQFVTAVRLQTHAARRRGQRRARSRAYSRNVVTKGGKKNPFGKIRVVTYVGNELLLPGWQHGADVLCASLVSTTRRPLCLFGICFMNCIDWGWPQIGKKQDVSQQTELTTRHQTSLDLFHKINGGKRRKEGSEIAAQCPSSSLLPISINDTRTEF